MIITIAHDTPWVVDEISRIVSLTDWCRRSRIHHDADDIWLMIQKSVRVTWCIFIFISDDFQSGSAIVTRYLIEVSVARVWHLRVLELGRVVDRMNMGTG